MKKVSDYYTGGELIDRLGILPIELVDGIRRQVVPYPSSEIKKEESRTPDSDPALFDPALCESPQAWVEMVRAARFFKPWVQLSWARIVTELGTCWEQDTQEQGQIQEAAAPEVAPVVPHFASPLELVQYHRGRGVHGLHELARLVDEEFTETAKLTDEALGRLLPANPGAEISDEGHKRQGHRLRKAYQQKR